MRVERVARRECMCWLGQVGVFAGGLGLVFCVHGEQAPACCSAACICVVGVIHTPIVCVLMSKLMWCVLLPVCGCAQGKSCWHPAFGVMGALPVKI